MVSTTHSITSHVFSGSISELPFPSFSVTAPGGETEKPPTTPTTQVANVHQKFGFDLVGGVGGGVWWCRLVVLVLVGLVVGVG
jgi:hypothetical protein